MNDTLCISSIPNSSSSLCYGKIGGEEEEAEKMERGRPRGEGCEKRLGEE